VLGLLALLAASAAANPPPQIRPMRLGSSAETTAVRVELPAEAAASGTAGRAAPRPDPRAAAAPVPAPGAAAAAEDPLEQLRQRLAGRLARQTLHDEAASPYDLKVVARTTPLAAAPPSARSAARAARPAAPPPPPPEWAYKGEGAPPSWARLKPEYRLCGSGQRQSPIDIRGGLAVDLEPVNFAYADSRFGVLDSGKTVKAGIAPGNHIEIGGQRFELQHLQFNRPSEHRIDGRQFEMSAHLVHRDAQGQLAIVELLIDRGPANPVVQTVWNNLPLEQGQEVPARVSLPLPALLPEDRRYFTYMGSLTTPPCTEGVRWVVMRQPVSLSAEQIELFARIYPLNARPVQQLAGRRILQSQ
jgi:carbonic anhydrase